MSDNNNNVMMAGLLLVGAYMMTRRQLVATPVQPVNGAGLNSLPGNIGTGVGQALGGALGNMIGSWFKSSTTPTAANAGVGANGSYYMSDNDSGSATDWALPIATGEETNGNWWDTIA